MRLIDADALYATLKQRDKQLTGLFGDLGGAASGAAKLVLVQPTVDAVPVVHGRWQYHINANNEVNPEDAYCSKCGFYVDVTTTFNFNKYLHCPYCGTRMDGKDGEEHD